MRILLLLLVAALAGCGSTPPGFTAADAVEAFDEAGLDVPNPRDVTDTECADSGCEEAVATDVVTVSRWAEPTAAHRHSTALQQPAYAVGRFVLAFPVGTDAATNDYADALSEALAEEDDA